MRTTLRWLARLTLAPLLGLELCLEAREAMRGQRAGTGIKIVVKP